MSRYVRVAALAGAAAFLSSCGGSTHHSGASSSTTVGTAAGTGGSPSGPGPTTGSEASGGIVFKASGPAVAQALDIDINNQTYNAMQAVPLPWSNTVQFQAGFTSYALRVQSASPSPPVSCEIDVPGHTPVTLTATAGQNFVFCQTG